MHLSKFLGRSTVALAALLLIVSSASQAAQKSTYRLIQDEYAKGTMSEHDRMLLEVRSVKNLAALPPALQSTVVETEKCATEIFLEVRKNWNLFSTAEQGELKNYLARPTRSFSYNSPGGNFKIWYNTTGTHAVPTADTAPANGVPDYIEWIGNYCDSSYRAEITNLGHLVPPSDGAAGGDSRYDIYTEEMGYYGYTQPESAGPNPWNDASSYISVHRNFSGFPANDDPEGDQKGAAKVTVAHEYYHAVQFAYDVGEDSWFMEAAATWMEDVVYDPVNDNYNYCSEWFTVPDLSLHSTSGLHLYAAFIWPVYLSRNYGNSILPQLWELLKTTTPYPAFAAALGTQGKLLNPEVARFDSWNFITSTRDDGLHYEEGSHYPLISLTRTHNTYPISGQAPLAGKAPDAMGANYVVFNIPVGAQSMTVTFNGDNSTPWIVSMMAWKSSPSDVYSESTMVLDGSGDGTYTLNNAMNWNSLVMVISNVSQTLNDRTYTYGASYSTAPAVSVSVTSTADDSVYSNTSVNLGFQVQNNGATSELYNLTVANTGGWTATPSVPTISLNSGESGNVSVHVVCPPGTLPFVLNDVMLTATANSIAGVSDVDTATVEVLVMHGDANNSGAISVSDVVYDINYIFAGGPLPIPVIDAGDANCSGTINVSDAVYLILFIFGGGAPPPCNPL